VVAFAAEVFELSYRAEFPTVIDTES
jgi:hypothetical protein